MVSSGSRQIQDNLSCGVCLERFNSSNHLPKILSCEHTFCTSCIDSLISNSLTLDGFNCPVCHSGITFDGILTNLVLRDIVEEVTANETAKRMCSVHPSMECQLVCSDCCQLLCGVCMLTGDHVMHTVVAMNDAVVEMKKRLTTALETKIANLENTIADKMTHYKRSLDIIVYMITKTTDKWKNTQVQRAQLAIDKKLATSIAQQESWKENLDLSDIQRKMTACKETEAAESSAIDISLPKVNLEEMQSNLKDLCVSVKARIELGHCYCLLCRVVTIK